MVPMTSFFSVLASAAVISIMLLDRIGKAFGKKAPRAGF